MNSAGAAPLLLSGITTSSTSTTHSGAPIRLSVRKLKKSGKGELLFSVTLADCDVDTFSAGGPGGQHQNRSQTGVRIKHRESGAVGESRETRSQLQNKRAAFRRMTETGKFRVWLNQKIMTEGRDLEAEVRREMQSQNILVEGYNGDSWEVIG